MHIGNITEFQQFLSLCIEYWRKAQVDIKRTPSVGDIVYNRGSYTLTCEDKV